MVTDVVGTIPKVLVKELEELEIGGRTRTIQTIASIRLARILTRVIETFCQSDSSGNNQRTLE